MRISKRATQHSPFFPLIILLTLPFLVSAVFKDDAYVTDWHIPLLGPPLPSSTFFHRPSTESKASLIYTLTSREIFAAINPKDGEIVWRQQLRERGILAKPGANGVVVVATEKRVMGFAATSGRLTWEHELRKTVDLEAMLDGSLVVLDEDGIVRWIKGDTVKKRQVSTTQPRDSAPHSLWLADDEKSVIVVSVQKGKHIDFSAIAFEQWESPATITSTKAAVQELKKSGPVISWREDAGRMLKLLALDTLGPSPTSVSIPTGTRDVDILASGKVVIVQFKGERKSWATVYRISQEKEIMKAYDLNKDDETKSTFSIHSFLGKEYVIWTLASGETLLYSPEKPTNLATYTALKSLDAGSLSGAISEVVSKSDGKYAIRTFLTGSRPGFVGDTYLIRNGEVAWQRKESLSSVVASAWVELLDPATEEIVDELDVETHTSIGTAYMHRVKRHIQEIKAYGPDWVKQLPHRIYAAFMDIDTTDERTGKWRDFFGFRKYAIVVTVEGGVTAIDVGRKGAVVWEVSLHEPEAELSGISIIQEVRKGVVGLVLTGGYYFEFNAFEGTVITRQKLGNPVRATAFVDKGTKAIIAILEGNNVVALPKDTKLKEPVYLVTQHPSGTLEGLRVSPGLETTVTWSFAPPRQEQISAISTRPPHDPIASIGRVLGDRSVTYKYLNPHLLALTTVNPTLSTVSVYVLDSVSGSLLYSAVHQGADTSRPILITLSENWLLYTYFGDDDMVSSGAAKGHHLVVSDLYESSDPNDRGPLNSAKNVTSFSLVTASAKPHVVSQAYLIPASISAFSITTTKQGITSREILAYLPDLYAILAIPKRIVEPRRPIGRDPTAAEQEEGLMKYAPVIDVDPRSLITHERDVFVKRIVTTPSQLESTSLVFAYGGDLFGTRVAPSLVFDQLGKGFGKVQLVVTVAALAVGAAVVAPWVRKKQIDQRWMAL